MESYENVHVTITRNLRRHLLRRWIQQRDALNAKPENCLRKIKLFLGDSEYFCFFLDSSCWRNIENKIRRTLMHLPRLAHVFRILFRDREAGIEEKSWAELLGMFLWLPGLTPACHHPALERQVAPPVSQCTGREKSQCFQSNVIIVLHLHSCCCLWMTFLCSFFPSVNPHQRKAYGYFGNLAEYIFARLQATDLLQSVYKELHIFSLVSEGMKA